MWAVASSNLETVDVLLKAGADVAAEADDGSTAMTFAGENPELTRRLEAALEQK